MPTIVDLPITFLCLAADPTVQLELGVTAKILTPAVTGKVNQYAGGRFRAVAYQGLGRSLDVTFGLVAYADQQTIGGWAGQLVCYRDPQGLKLFGTFFAPKVTAQAWPNVADVEVVIGETTYSEAV